jgi:hypothetical protein
MCSVCTDDNRTVSTCAILEEYRYFIVVLFDFGKSLAPVDRKICQKPLPESRALCTYEGRFGRVLFLIVSQVIL